jgi:hypothetical protein
MIEQGHIAEANDRTVGPFTAVINEYRTHAARIVRRTDRLVPRPATPEEIAATIYYLGTAELLESMNGTQ